MPLSAYRTECDDCGERIVFPAADERVVEGTRAHRTVNDEWEQAALRARFDDDPAERDRGEKRKQKLAKWEHYCPECARERGIAPSGPGAAE